MNIARDLALALVDHQHHRIERGNVETERKVRLQAL